MFECDIQTAKDSDIDKLLAGKDVFLKSNKVTFGMANKGNTCFFNSVM